jgi:uncharacterized integral membrane protein
MRTPESSNVPPADVTPPQRSGDHGPESVPAGTDSAAVAAPSAPARRLSVRRSRLGGMWAILLGTSISFVVLLIFILQNPASTDIHFLWWDGALPVGVAMLLSAFAGILLTAIPGTGRIWQLRRGIRHAPHKHTSQP